MGEGAFGKVKIASLHENRKKKFAIKSISREILDKHFDRIHDSFGNLDESHSSSSQDEEQENDFKHMQQLIEQEILILLKMDHPSIVKFH